MLKSITPIPLKLLKNSSGLWLDASDTSSYNITQSNNLVEGWRDKFRCGFDAYQLTGTKQPSTNIATINGLNAIRFSKAKLLEGNYTSPQRFTIFIVALHASGSTIGDGMRFFLTTETNGLMIYHGSSDSGEKQSCLVLGTSEPIVTISSTEGMFDSPYILEVSYDESTLSIIRNNTYSASSSYNAVTIDSSSYAINQHLDVNTDIGEIIVYNRYLSESERQLVREEYLNKKWRIY